ncbi:GNAT family N-acetyltransferase [Ruegeria halocynthiae]|uniref:GNAT family N-acetyltransferase n=1 Tax=Ruegeria halocynthiae TaxID=985054 RepID=UPI000565D03A|nr:GNAT family N-acetyltransferase [Ruegeria halocynthiae]
MTWRLAKPEDVPSIERFLRQHIQSSMFPLANLRDFGLNGPDPRSVRMWLLGDDLRAIFTITNEGMILPQCPDCSDVELEAVIALIAEHPTIGVIGDAAQCRRILRLAGWQDRPANLNKDEPAFSLDLNDLILPELADAWLVPLAEIDRALAEQWRSAYLIETPGLILDEVAKQAAHDIDAYLARDSHRALLVRGQPVGMTGFNAALPDIVQIGGVYTPTELRGRGYARTAVALHLQEAQAAGVSRAVLFAASNSAARAYISIGFVPAGQFALILFKTEKETVA